MSENYYINNIKKLIVKLFPITEKLRLKASPFKEKSKKILLTNLSITEEVIINY